MKITLAGKAVLFLIFLTLWNAVNGGLNTLYMVYSALAGALIVSWAGVRLAALFVRVRFALPEQIFSDEPVPLRIEIRNIGLIPVFGITIRSRWGSAPFGHIGPRRKRDVTIAYRFTRRGMNDITDLCVEFAFPFGIFVRRKTIGIRNILVFPAMTQMPGRPKARDTVSDEIAVLRRGAGDEFFGIREFSEGDDVRLINWKLSAKAGRPLIKEYAEIIGNRIVVRVSGLPPGAGTERKIAEAASVARFFIDEGAEVRVVSNEGDTGYGRGLLHLEAILKHLATIGDGKRSAETGSVPRGEFGLPSIGEGGLVHSLAYLLVTAVAASLWLVQGLDLATKVVVSAVVPAAWILNRRGRYPIPASVFQVASFAVLAAVLFLDIPFTGLLPGLMHMLSYTLINRLLSPKTGRDTGTILVILYLIFLLVSWQTVEISYFAAYIAFFSMLGFLVTVMSCGRFPARGDGGFGLNDAVGAAVSIFLMFAVAGVAFAATPRVHDSRFAKVMRRIGLANIVAPELSIVGLADRMDLGSFGDVRTNTRRAMQVKIAGFDAEEGATLKIRAGALNHFDGKSWTRVKEDFIYRFMGDRATSDRGEGFYGRSGAMFSSSAYDANKKSIIEEFYIYPMSTPVIFSVGDPTAVEGGIRQPSFDLGGTVYSAYSHESGTRYIVRSQSEEIRIESQIEDYASFLKSIYLDLPPVPEMQTVRKEAALAANGVSGNFEKARALQKYFHDNFTYSYSARHKRQTLSEFLTAEKSADCEYFSTAMTLMLRSLGVPARVAIGYLAKDWKKVGGYFDIRNSDGHAWVEVHIDGQGWLAFDPTPSTVRAPDAAFGFGGALYMYFLDAQMSWYRYVIGYDFYTQQDALAGVIERWRGIVAYAAMGLAAIFILYAAGLFIRSRVLFGRGAFVVHPASAAYLEAEKILARYGFFRKSWQTPAEFMAGIGKRLHDAAGAADIADNYYRWRYGGRRDGGIKTLILRLKSHLKHRADLHV